LQNVKIVINYYGTKPAAHPFRTGFVAHHTDLCS